MPSPLTLNAAELLRQPGSRKHVDARVDLADADVHDPRVAGEVHVVATATSSLDDVVVAGTLTVGWRDECRRCLRPLAAELVVDVEERYVPAAEAGGADADAFPIEHGQLDLTPMVREGLLLGLPDAPLCRDDCPGLCATCGADIASGPCGCVPAARDERWAVLDQLRDEP